MKTGAIPIAFLLLVPGGLWAQTDSKNTQAAPQASESSRLSRDSASSAATGDAGDHKWHLRLGTIGVGAGYFQGPLFYPYAPLAYPWFYAPWDPFAGPFWGSYYPGQVPNFLYADGKGEVRLTGAPKGARIYVNGGYAGVAERLKHMWLDPGAYDLAVSVAGRQTFQQRIYVLSGKVLKIAADQTPNPNDKEDP